MPNLGHEISKTCYINVPNFSHRRCIYIFLRTKLKLEDIMRGACFKVPRSKIFSICTGNSWFHIITLLFSGTPTTCRVERGRKYFILRKNQSVTLEIREGHFGAERHCKYWESMVVYLFSLIFLKATAAAHWLFVVSPDLTLASFSSHFRLLQVSKHWYHLVQCHDFDVGQLS